MGKTDSRNYKASSSAKAAEALAARAAAAAGFGGFSGAQPISATVAAPGSAFGGHAAAAAALAQGGEGSEPMLSAQLDSEVAQCLRHLSKRDPVTKLKALQNMRSVLAARQVGELSALLPPWAYIYRKLVMDNSRQVRYEAHGAMGDIAAAAGKQLAPHLRALMGSWWLAQFDPHPDVAAAARTGLQASFPGRKQLDALLYCRGEVLSLLLEYVGAAPVALGDPRKESTEALEERHERVVSAAFMALGTMLEVATRATDGEVTAAAATAATAAGAADGRPSVPPSRGPPGAAASAVSDILQRLRALLCGPGFFKRYFGAKSPSVRRAAYAFLQPIARQAPQLLDGCLQDAAPAVLGAFHDKETSNHTALWEMVLAFAKARPDSWDHVNMSKAIQPRLFAFLRHGCYGSGKSSYPALLPLLTLMPLRLLGPDPHVLLELVNSIWSGLQHCQGRTVKAAGAATYAECLVWALLASPRLASGGPDDTAALRHALLAGSFTQSVLPAALTADTDEEAGVAAEAVCSVARQVAGAAANKSGTEQGQQLQYVLRAVLQTVTEGVSAQLSRAVAGLDEAPPAPEPAVESVVLRRCEQLLALLQGTPTTAASAAAVAGDVAPRLQSAVHRNGPSAAGAAKLLAYMVRGLHLIDPDTPSPGISSSGGGDHTAASASTAVNGVAAAISGTLPVGLDLDSLVRAALATSADGSAAAANVELLLSCVIHSRNPSGAWAALLELLSPHAAVQGDASSRGDRLRLLGMLLRGAANTAAQAALAGSSALDAIIGPLATADSLAGESAAADVLACALRTGAAGDCLLSSSTTAAVLGALREHLRAGAAPGAADVEVQAATAAVACVARVVAVPRAVVWRLEPSLCCELVRELQQMSWGAETEADGTGEAAPHESDADSTASDDSASVSSGSLLAELGAGGEAGTDVEPEIAEQGHAATADKTSVHPSGPVNALRNAAAHAWGAGVLLDAAAASLPAAASRQLCRDVLAAVVRRLSAEVSCQRGVDEQALVRWQQRAADVIRHCPDAALQRELIAHLLSAVKPLISAPASGVAASATLLVNVAAAMVSMFGPAQVLYTAPRSAATTNATDATEAAPSTSVATVGGINAGLALDLLVAGGSAAGGDRRGRGSLSPEHQRAAKLVLDHLVTSASDDDAVGGSEDTIRGGNSSSTCAITALEVVLQAAIARSSSSSSSKCDEGSSSSTALPPQADDPDVPCALLRELAARAEVAPRAADVIQAISGRLRDAADAGTLVRLMPIIAAVLRREPGRLRSSDLPTFTTAGIRTLTEALPVPRVGRPQQGAVPGASQAVAIGSELLSSLQLTAACFPVPNDAVASGGRSAPMPEAGAATAAERRALLLLCRALSGGLSAGGVIPAAALGPGGEQALASLHTQLQQAAACYCWRDMMDADWRSLHGLLRSSLQVLTAQAAALAEDVAAAALDTARAIVAGKAVTLSGPQMAIQLLSRLVASGAAAHQSDMAALPPQLQHLADAHPLPAAALLVPQTCVMLQQIQPHIRQLSDAPHQQLEEWLAELSAAVLQFAATASCVISVACSLGCSSSVLSWMSTPSEGFWRSVCHMGEAANPSAFATAAAAASTRLEPSGLDLVDGLLNSLMLPGGAHHHHHHTAAHQQRDDSTDVAPANNVGSSGTSPLGGRAAAALSTLQRLSWRLLLHDPALTRLTFASSVSQLDELEDVDAHPAEYLVKAGLRSDMARIVTSYQPKPAPQKQQRQQRADPRPCGVTFHAYLYAWALLLAHVSAAPLHSEAQRLLTQALRDVTDLVPRLLDALCPLLLLQRGPTASTGRHRARACGGDEQQQQQQQQQQRALAQHLLDAGFERPSTQSGSWSAARALQDHELPQTRAQLVALSAVMYRAVLHVLPASARLWHGDLRDRGLATAIEAHTAQHESPLLLAAELASIQDSPYVDDKFSVKANSTTREVVASMDIEDGAMLELAIKLPTCSPLKPATVECRRKVGVNDNKLRKWLLSISVFLRNQNRSVADAVAMWKRNVDKEFEGLQPCLICYSVISSANSQLPRLECVQCHVNFHPGCLYKWFKSSGKSQCPHCQSPWQW